jgi:hypothetical protein
MDAMAVLHGLRELKAMYEGGFLNEEQKDAAVSRLLGNMPAEQPAPKRARTHLTAADGSFEPSTVRVPVTSKPLREASESSDWLAEVRDRCRPITSSSQSPSALQKTRSLLFESGKPLVVADAEREAEVALIGHVEELRPKVDAGYKVAIGLTGCRKNGSDDKFKITRCRVAPGVQFYDPSKFEVGSSRIILVGWADENDDLSHNGLSRELLGKLEAKIQEVATRELGSDSMVCIDRPGAGGIGHGPVRCVYLVLQKP